MKKLIAVFICLFLCGLFWGVFNLGGFPEIQPYIIMNKYIRLSLLIWNALPYIVMLVSILGLLVTARKGPVESE